MHRGVLLIGALMMVAGCSVPWRDPAPLSHQDANVALTPDVVARTWVGHTSGAAFTFSKDGTVDAEGVATATFDTAEPFARNAPHGPYRCHGTWTIGPAKHELTVRFDKVVDAGGREPIKVPRELKYTGLNKDEYPQFTVVLYSYEDWLAPQ